MEDTLIKTAFKEMKSKMPEKKGCPDDTDICRFVEGGMDEKASERIEKHLVSCPTCCDYVVSLNRVITFSEEENLPEVPPEKIRAVDQLLKEMSETFGQNFRRENQRMDYLLEGDEA